MFPVCWKLFYWFFTLKIVVFRALVNEDGSISPTWDGTSNIRSAGTFRISAKDPTISWPEKRSDMCIPWTPPNGPCLFLWRTSSLACSWSIYIKPLCLWATTGLYAWLNGVGLVASAVPPTMTTYLFQRYRNCWEFIGKSGVTPLTPPRFFYESLGRGGGEDFYKGGDGCCEWS